MKSGKRLRSLAFEENLALNSELLTVKTVMRDNLFAEMHVLQTNETLQSSILFFYEPVMKSKEV